MGVTLSFGDALKAFKHFNMQRIRNNGFMYEGMGKDGINRICKLDYHAAGRLIAPGTANKIAQDLGFKNLKELKYYLDRHL